MQIKPGANESQGHLFLQPDAQRAPEVDQQDHGKRTKGGKSGHGRVADDLVAQREHRRHATAPGPPGERGQVPVPASEPFHLTILVVRRLLGGGPSGPILAVGPFGARAVDLPWGST